VREGPQDRDGGGLRGGEDPAKDTAEDHHHQQQAGQGAKNGAAQGRQLFTTLPGAPVSPLEANHKGNGHDPEPHHDPRQNPGQKQGCHGNVSGHKGVDNHDVAGRNQQPGRRCRSGYRNIEIPVIALAIHLRDERATDAGDRRHGRPADGPE
jgi:hypothetical protein